MGVNSTLTSQVSQGRSRGRTADRTRSPKPRWFRPSVMELEDRITPTDYGFPLGTIEHSVLDTSLVAEDAVYVEIESANSSDTFTLNDGQLAGNLKLVLDDGYTPTVGDTFAVVTGTAPLTGSFTYQGLGFHDGLYFAPVISDVDNTLSLEVRSLNKLNTLTALETLLGSFTFEVDASGTGLTVTASALSIDLGGLVSVSSGDASFTLNTETGDLAGSASADLAVNFPGLTGSGTVSLEIDTANDFVKVDADGLALSLTAGAFTLDLTGDFSFEKSGSDVAVTGADVNVVFSAGAEELVNATADFDFSWNDTQFTINNASLTFNDTFTIASVLELDSPSVGIRHIVVENGGTFRAGSISLGPAAGTVFPRSTTFTGSATGILGTYDFTTGAFSVDIDHF